MFRRTASRSPQSGAPDVTSPAPAGADRPEAGRPGADLAGELEAAGWVLPRGLRQQRTAWSLVGTVSSPLATPVDPGGLVSGEGWSLDWWVGADDR